MSVTKEERQALIKDFRRAPEDSGSPEVQVAIITKRVKDLTQHMHLHPKDYSTRRGLMALVGRRRRLLDYLKKVNPQGYLNIIGRLDLRK
ncbi:MAG: 30S ribosomal protein S15 [Planctomycetia bacterium]|jgi:small subunit ribosomal protein S15|nr:30S ribosomal protein S15 [Planctomycetia bacterium]